MSKGLGLPCSILVSKNHKKRPTTDIVNNPFDNISDTIRFIKQKKMYIYQHIFEKINK